MAAAHNKNYVHTHTGSVHVHIGDYVARMLKKTEEQLGREKHIAVSMVVVHSTAMVVPSRTDSAHIHDFDARTRMLKMTE